MTCTTIGWIRRGASALALSLLFVLVGCASQGSRPFSYGEFETRMDRTVPGLSDDAKKQIFEFHQAHPDVKLGKNLADIWQFRSDRTPALTKGDIAKMWEFHVNHPEIEFGSALADVWSYHMAHPQFGMDDLKLMWKFRMEHPEIRRQHLADMWRFHRDHPNQSKADFQKAYQTYQEDPDAFQNARTERMRERMQRDGS